MKPKLTLQELAALQATKPGSVTALKDLTPVRLATQRALADGEQWSGFPLTSATVTTSLFGGPHYRISLRSERKVPSPDAALAPAIPVFVVRWSCTNEQLYDAAFHAQVQATADAYMDLLNMRRIA